MNSKAIIYFLLVPAVLGTPFIPITRLSVATWGSYYQQDHKGPGTYIFGYDIENPETGNIQFKQEERHPNGTVTGNYGYVDADGRPNVVTYISDKWGYRAKVEKVGEPPQYFPNAQSFWGGPVQQQIQEKNQRVYPSRRGFIEKDNRIDSSPALNKFSFSTPFYKSYNSPSYFKYARLNAIE